MLTVAAIWIRRGQSEASRACAAVTSGRVDALDVAVGASWTRAGGVRTFVYVWKRETKLCGFGAKQNPKDNPFRADM